MIAAEVLGPPDIERHVGLTGGHIFQGEILPDYLWDRRLTPETPMPGVYLCGACTHPGGQRDRRQRPERGHACSRRFPGLDEAPRMSSEAPLPEIYLARHGETAWAISGQHTGKTDIPLTERGERNARALGDRLKGLSFTEVRTSPRHRATRSCELAGFEGQARVDPDLAEWDYGDYEGRKTVDIRVRQSRLVPLPRRRPRRRIRRRRRGPSRPGDRPPPRRPKAGSSSSATATSSGSWPPGGSDSPPGSARHFLLGTASLSILGYEHNPEEPVIRLWNDNRHVQD